MAPVVETFQSATLHVTTPDGEMFVNIMEDTSGKPIQIQIMIGKAGTSVAAWSDAVTRLVNMHLRKGGSLEDVVCELSSITTSAWRFLTEGVTCRSGPEGLVIAILKYRNATSIDDKATIPLSQQMIDLNRPARMYRNG